MSEPADKTVAVIGATGAQGGGVVRALRAQAGVTVRALTRDPAQAAGLGDEVVEADLTRPETLAPALEGAYGVFANTNSFGGPDTDEIAQGTAAATAAKAAGVEHYVWSTLPNVAEISDGAFTVPHFTNKARVDEAVAGAGFPRFTFVEPPFYFQNLASPMYAPQPGPDGKPTWFQPMQPDSRSIHMGDISELGDLVAGAFEHGDRVGDGAHLSLAGDFMSWDAVVTTLRGQGHDLAFSQASASDWDESFPGAREIRAMFEYFEAFTYFGPDAEAKIAQANDVSTKPFTDLAAWAKANMSPEG